MGSYVGGDIFVAGISGRVRREPVLVHHPVGLDALGGSSSVEDERFLQSNAGGAVGGVDGPVGSGGLPESCAGDAVGPRAVPVLAVSGAVEVPFLFSSHCQLLS